MLRYAFYMPYMVRQITPYPSFEEQLKARRKLDGKGKARDWRDIGLHAVRMLAYCALADASLYLFHFKAIVNDDAYFGSVPLDRLFVLTLAMGDR